MTEPTGPEFLVPRERAPQVVIVEPDPVWAEQYAEEERLIGAALAPVLGTLEHVGSTSVPDLAAKPVVDILVTVADPADESSYVLALESVGYTFHHREPHWHQHRLFKKGTPHFAPGRPEGEPRVNLHVFPATCDEVRRMLVFRDWLRTSSADRALYAEVKRELATRDWDVVQDYADAKTEVVTAIMQRALAAQPSNGDGSPAPTRTTSG